MRGVAAQFQGAALERHRARRAQRVPTVSLLIADPAVGEWYWSEWQRAHDTRVVQALGGALPELLVGWLGARSVREELRAAFERAAAAATGVSVEELCARIAAHAEGQRETLLEQLCASTPGWPLELVAAALSDEDGALPSVALLDFPATLARIDALVPGALPALIVRVRPEMPFNELDQALSALVQVAEAAPGVELAIVLDEYQLSDWESRAEEREAALVREGLLWLEPVHAGSKPPRVKGPVRRRSVPDLRLAVVHYDADEFARSRAELLLYRHLEARARTQGLFELNQSLPERFAGKPLEVDLLCQSLRLAIEVDGHRHFRDASAYRRDRSKDVLLQQLGYTVVRVLASDVEQELQYVVDTIDRAVEHHREEKPR
jgi:very-short-patch-repair endonuclease